MNKKYLNNYNKEWLVEYLAALWQDIRFNREQDWRIMLGPIITNTAVIATLLRNTPSKTDFSINMAIVVAVAIALVFSSSGLLIALRHRKLFLFRMKAIECIEKWLGLDVLQPIYKQADFRISTGFLLANLYVTLVVINLSILIYFIVNNLLLTIFFFLINYFLFNIIIIKLYRKWKKEREKVRCSSLQLDNFIKIKNQ
jgi:hypothetical protein